VTKKLRRLFPKLGSSDYKITSVRTKRYNCMAWSLSRNDFWLDAFPDGGWPPHLVHDGSVQAAIALFEYLGFRCTSIDDLGFEDGVSRIAIYGDSRGYTHVARQIGSGKWTSKLGTLQDIEHDSLDALTSVGHWIGTSQDTAYGTLAQIMKADEALARQQIARTFPTT
jgi:hypothetical protein